MSNLTRPISVKLKSELDSRLDVGKANRYDENTMKYQRGFTLLELLVVVSIIGILIAMIAAGFSTAQSRSRDARRRADIKAAQNGFEQYYANNSGAYGGTCAAMAIAPYLPGGLPVDPQTGTAYGCSISGGTTGYCICADLESTTGGNSSSGNCAFVSGNSGGYFCASNLQ